MTHRLAVLACFEFIQSEQWYGMFNSKRVKCNQWKVQLDIHGFCPGRDEGCYADKVGCSLRLLFFTDFLTWERGIKTSDDRTGCLFGGKGVDEELIIAFHQDFLGRRIIFGGLVYDLLKLIKWLSGSTREMFLIGLKPFRGSIAMCSRISSWLIVFSCRWLCCGWLCRFVLGALDINFWETVLICLLGR